jgi:hypothetical protein
MRKLGLPCSLSGACVGCAWGGGGVVGVLGVCAGFSSVGFAAVVVGAWLQLTTSKTVSKKASSDRMMF